MNLQLLSGWFSPQKPCGGCSHKPLLSVVCKSRELQSGSNILEHEAKIRFNKQQGMRKKPKTLTLERKISLEVVIAWQQGLNRCSIETEVFHAAFCRSGCLVLLSAPAEELPMHGSIWGCLVSDVQKSKKALA